MPDGSPGKLRGNEHRALYMDMGVDKAGEDKLPGDVIGLGYGVDPAVPDRDGPVKDASVDDIKDGSSDFLHRREWLTDHLGVDG